MEKKEQLTNEQIKKKFPSQFELVNYAIRLAENMIYSGRETEVFIEGDNVALHVIGEIVEGKDKFVDLREKAAPEGAASETFSTRNPTMNGNHITDDETPAKKSVERKRRAASIVK